MLAITQLAGGKYLGDWTGDLDDNRYKVLVPYSLSQFVQVIGRERPVVATNKDYRRDTFYIKDSLGADLTVCAEQRPELKGVGMGL
ncbi:MAG: hypothetical protein OXE50_15125, partial [Chloroflexi bacterium]|nr:hypothetical protein [Chloroflexota bacterium]